MDGWIRIYFCKPNVKPRFLFSASPSPSINVNYWSLILHSRRSSRTSVIFEHITDIAVVNLAKLTVHSSPASSFMQSDGENQCLKAAQDCGLYEKCGSLRSEYVLACTKRVPGSNRCNQHKCHRALRRFLERVPEEYSLTVLFCPCTDTLCGERRRKTIVPSCSYQETEEVQPNCLHQQSFCRRDDLCR